MSYLFVILTQLDSAGSYRDLQVKRLYKLKVSLLLLLYEAFIPRVTKEGRRRPFDPKRRKEPCSTRVKYYCFRLETVTFSYSI